jgi:hypothetical protein
VEWMADIKIITAAIGECGFNLDESQLHVPYREGGWT